jgi:mono/diheme cytochrome c family protein
MKKPIALFIALVVSGSVCLRAADLNENWTKHCGSCHGKDGKGQTKAGKMADTKDFTDAKYQESFNDEDALQQVKLGLKDKNGKDRMKPFQEKLTEAEIKELLAYVRKFKK